MLLSIGPKKRPEDLVELLLECHARIRSFIRIAEDVGQHTAAPDEEVIEACRSCERYFTEALPLHVEDEEVSVLPRLRGRDPAVDEALATMHEQHDDHRPQLEALREALQAVRADPGQPAHRERLLAVAAPLVLEFEAHLQLEEQVILPAIRSSLPPEAQAAVMEELRARRSPDRPRA